MNYTWSIQQSMHWIESHLNETLTVEEIAAAAGFSMYHFHRIFQTEVGMSPAAYVKIRRLAHAAAALLHTNERILDIALFYRFESQEVFTRVFKRAYGLPPGRYRKTMRQIIQKEEGKKMEQQMDGWFLSGSHPFNYEMGVDRKVVHTGKASGYLSSKTVQDPGEFATMMQQFKADRYRGKRLKLSCFIQTQNVEGFAGLWMRIDSASDDVLQFDNMSNRPIKGTTTWNHYTVVLDVPENSAVIAFGVLLSGGGRVFVDQFSFEEVDEKTESTAINIEGFLADEPVNLSFE
ncbi:helix-turn-helix domain-containing protein [Domibacillus robiginosus]|uniref:helix-turn-helix domain-containing protein n=1 Tax=Domibacillus robiginosus TaxID=1071054 RepID=UPI00067D756A|nr:AraC family transcriptional regulator [Domibacillus robiginosus]